MTRACLRYESALCDTSTAHSDAWAGERHQAGKGKDARRHSEIIGQTTSELPRRWAAHAHRAHQ